jgi:hypothetical protein
MGFAANQAREMLLVSRKSDLEMDVQFIEEHKLYLSNMTNQYFGQQASLEPNSPALKLLNARIRQLQQAEKILDMHLKRINTQREAIIKELESVDKVISKSIEGSFGLMK